MVSLRWSAAVLALLVWLHAAVPAAAHSELVSSTPAAGSSVVSAPGMSIVLSFSEALKKGSKADVVDPSGATVGTAAIDPADQTKLTWTAAVALAPGSYNIRWTSIAADGDILRGTIPFTVTAAAPLSSSPSPSLAQSPPSSDASTSSVILPLVAALAVIAVLAFALLRRRRPT